MFYSRGVRVGLEGYLKSPKESFNSLDDEKTFYKESVSGKGK